MIKSTKNMQHYEWGKQCKGWHLLKSDSLSVIQEVIPPGTHEVTHFHQKSQQLFYILKGTAIFEVDGMVLTAGPHESIHILPGIKHRIINNNKQNLHFLVISEPESHMDKIFVVD